MMSKTLIKTSDSPGKRDPGSSSVQKPEASSQLRRVSAGIALDHQTRRTLEPRFGFDFSRIRIHSDANAASAAAEVGALAYTVGQHIFFGKGQYAPATRLGSALLAHELAHAVQQGANTSDGLSDLHSSGLRSSTVGEERDAERACMLVSASEKTGLIPGSELALARVDKPHDTEDFGDAARDFSQKNTQLSHDQRSKIRSAIIKVTYKAKTHEVGYAFFSYYSSHKIVLMTDPEEKKAREQDRVAETDPAGDTKVRADVLAFADEALGALLLHELSHTGHVTNVAGSGDYQEGHSYGIEYFYAERNADADRMGKILLVISAGSVALPSQRPALQQLFKVSYAVMTVLRKLEVTGSASELPIKDLGSDDGDVLSAEYVTHYANPSKRLRMIIDYVTANLASCRTPTLP